MDTDIMRVITATQVTPRGGCTVGMVVRAIPHSCLASVASPVARLDRPTPTWSFVPRKEENMWLQETLLPSATGVSQLFADVNCALLVVPPEIQSQI